MHFVLHIITTFHWVQISNMKLIPDLNVHNEKFDRNVLFAVLINKQLKNIKVENTILLRKLFMRTQPLW